MNAQTIYCSNCGLKGHFYKKCFKPIISLGVICLKYGRNINKMIENNGEDGGGDGGELRFLMICRKDTYSYVEFVRGNYDVSNDVSLKNLFERMTKKELEIVLGVGKEFDVLWKRLWNVKEVINFKREYEESGKKFAELIRDDRLKKIIMSVNCIYEEPEWGFPKGRRNLKENNLDCAMREFREETNINAGEYELLNMNTFVEIYTGSNNVEYKHVYYLSQIIDNNKELSVENRFQMNEISDIKWLKMDEIFGKLRGYQIEKMNLVSNIYNQLLRYM